MKVRKGLILTARKRAAGGGCYESEERVNNLHLGEEEQLAEERVNNSQLGEEEQMAVAVSPWLVSH
jgi:hypothetical protein